MITSIKHFIKKIVPLLPGYHSLCLALRKLRPKSWEWVDRIPVKPNRPILVHSKIGDFYLSHPERCCIAKKYFWTQGITKPVEDRIALNLFASLSKQSDVVIDVGANSGLFSLIAAKSNPNAEIFAFDILPEAYHVLIDNLILNNLLEKVKVQLIGVGEDGGVFYTPFNNILSAMPTSLSLDYKEDNDKTNASIPVKSLDKICLPHFAQKNMCIKIDVEGTEVDIFSHGLETLKIIKPDIICEILCGVKELECYQKILDECLYYKYLITSDGLKRIDKIKPNKNFKDWFFTTKKDFNIEIEELLK